MATKTESESSYKIPSSLSKALRSSTIPRTQFSLHRKLQVLKQPPEGVVGDRFVSRFLQQISHRIREIVPDSKRS